MFCLYTSSGRLFPTHPTPFPSDFPLRETAGIKPCSVAGAIHPGCGNTHGRPVLTPTAPQDRARTGCQSAGDKEQGQQNFTVMKAALLGCTYCLNSPFEHPLKYQWTLELLSFSHYKNFALPVSPRDAPPDLYGLQAYLHPDSGPDARILPAPRRGLMSPLGISHPPPRWDSVFPTHPRHNRCPATAEGGFLMVGAGGVTASSSFHLK